MGLSSSSATVIARIHQEATSARLKSIRIGTRMMTSTPSASVAMPEKVGTKSSANDATIASRWFHLCRSNSS